MLKYQLDLFLIAASMLFSLVGVAQTDVYADPGFDTNYILSFRDYLVVTVVSTSANNTVAVHDTSGESLSFATNLPASFGLAVDYKWLTAEYTSTFGRTGDPRKGETSMQSLGFGLTSRKFWFRNFFQKTQGYYLENPEYLNPNFNAQTDNYPHRSDIRATIYYAVLNYGFNHRRYSNNAALWQLERQKKSAGSFTAGLTFSYATYSADSALVPSKYRDFFSERDFITAFDFTMLGLNGGYLHTFSFTKSKKFFLSLALIPGVSYQRGSSFSEVSDVAKDKYAFGLHVEARISFGYNGDVWYSSITSTGYAVSTAFDDTNPFTQGYSFFRFVVGYKIRMPETKSALLKKIGL